MSLSGKTGIVFGASKANNIGQVTARRLVEAGARVVVSGRDADELDRFAAEIGATAKACDITDRAAVFAMVGDVGPVDFGVNATGWGLMKPFLDNDEDDMTGMTALQFAGPVWFFQALIENMPGGGSIVQVSSATATIMLENHALYMGTKAGIDHVVRTIANEFGARGIRANSVSPGLTDTPMAGGFGPAVRETFEAGYPLGRIGTAEDIAAAVEFLLSDECFMTGQNLQVNGGLTLRRNPNAAELGAAFAKDAEGAG